MLLEFPINDKVRDVWTLRDACQGTVIFGATGSGKTSGSGRAISQAFLKHGFGGLVLTTKPGDRQEWEEWAEEAGRRDDLIIISPDQEHRFNFLEYEYTRKSRGGGLTENVAQLFNTALEIADGGQQGKGNDPFWERSQTQMLRNAIDLLGNATGTLSLADLYKVISSAPQLPEEVVDETWQQNSYLYQIGINSDERYKTLSPMQQRDFDLAVDYWLREFPAMDSRTRSGIVSGFTSMADGLMRGVMYNLFCTTTTITPEATHDGAILLLDLPIKEYGMVGRVAQGIFKYLWQQATERRDISKNPRPVFLWVDESQFHVSSNDALFQTTARSSRVCTVYLTQNISNYYARINSGNAKAVVDSLMGNFLTKLFHMNGDAVTNTWASEQMSRGYRYKTSLGTSDSAQGGSSTVNISESLEYAVQPAEFLTLLSGGELNDRIVEAVVFKPGNPWMATGKPYRKVYFQQD